MSKKELNIIVPLRLDPEEGAEIVISRSKILFEKYGMKKFIYFCPSKGWRGKCYPPKEEFERCARTFLEIKTALKPMGISCGWWIATTVKAGYREDFQMFTRPDGSEHPFMICPLGENYRKAFCESMLAFVKIGEPDFVFTEDDFQIDTGCFCEKHLKGFEEYAGRFYSREEIVNAQKEKNNFELIKMWRSYSKSTVVGLAKTIRDALSKEYPHIPIGYMQTGAVDFEGDSTDELVRTLAGEGNTPMTRLFGCFYCGGDPAEMPRQLFHPLYSRQHLGDDIDFLHETDTYPHSKFYTSEKDVAAMFGMVFSWGFDGSIFHCTATAEKSFDLSAPYAEVFRRERKRLTEIAHLTRECEVSGVEVLYDPFCNTVLSDEEAYFSRWIKSVSQFGISYNTKKSPVAFVDDRFLRCADEKSILEYLSKGLFLDGDGAKALCDRGFGKYIGVEVGEDVFSTGKRMYDLGSQEFVCEPFGFGTMPAANGWCPAGQGILRELTVTDENCKIITQLKNFAGEVIAPAMTWFENSLGGKIVVMGMTLRGNNSFSLFHGARQNLIQNLISKISDDVAYVKNEAKVMLIANKPREKAEFSAILTLINMGADTVSGARVYIPSDFAKVESLFYLDIDGEWKKADYEKMRDDIIVKMPLEFQEPVYIMIK